MRADTPGRMARLLIIILMTTVLISPAPGPLFAGDKVLGLNEFLQGAIAANPDIFRELAKVRESGAVEIQSRAVYDIVFNVHYNRMYDRPFSDYSSVKIHEQTTDNAGANIQWAVPGAGTRVRAGLDYYWNRINLTLPSQSFPYTPYQRNVDLYNPEIFAEVQQPLLKNWLGIIDDFPVKQAKLNALIMKETADESIETVISDLYGLYFSWFLAHRQFEIYSRNVVNSEALLKQINEKFRSGLAERSDVSKVKIMNIEFLKAWDLQGTRLENITRKVVKWYTGDGNAADAAEFVPESELVLPRDPGRGFSVADTRQMKILNLSKEILEYKLRESKSELLPDLNFLLSYRLRNYTLQRDKSFSEFNHNNYTAGLVLTYPLGDHRGSGRYEETRASLKKWGFEVESFERAYGQTYGELRKLITAYDTVMARDEELLAQARVQLQDEEKKYREGRSDLYFVIQYRTSLATYELLRATDYTDSRNLAVQLLGLMDEIALP